MNKWLKTSDVNGKIIALVHDSILCEVDEKDVEQFTSKLREYVEEDRGLNIPNCPFVCDFEIGDDYSFGKYDSYMQKLQ